MASTSTIRLWLKIYGLSSYKLSKINGTWYVSGPGTEMWKTTCLNTAKFPGDPLWWANEIRDFITEQVEQRNLTR